MTRTCTASDDLLFPTCTVNGGGEVCRGGYFERGGRVRDGEVPCRSVGWVRLKVGVPSTPGTDTFCSNVSYLFMLTVWEG